MTKGLEEFKLPRWEELPPIPLYLEQVLELIDGCLVDYLGHDENKVITRTMVNNYVKLKFLPPAVNRKYDRAAVASLFVIAVLKSVYTIEEISNLTGLARGYKADEAMYNEFCRLTEEAVDHAFHGTTMGKGRNQNDPRNILWNVCNSFACKLYVCHTYLQGLTEKEK